MKGDWNFNHVTHTYLIPILSYDYSIQKTISSNQYQ